MNKLEIAKEIIKKNYSQADCGLYDERNVVGDSMTTLYDEDGLMIDICYGWGYFEVFGLSDGEFSELEDFYGRLKEHWDD